MLKSCAVGGGGGRSSAGVGGIRYLLMDVIYARPPPTNDSGRYPLCQRCPSCPKGGPGTVGLKPLCHRHRGRPRKLGQRRPAGTVRDSPLRIGQTIERAVDALVQGLHVAALAVGALLDQALGAAE